VQARPADIATNAAIELLPMSFTRTRVAIPVPDTLAGNVSVRLVDPRTNPIMLAVSPGGGGKIVIEECRGGGTGRSRPTQRFKSANRVRKNCGVISCPMSRFIFRWAGNEGLNARFQFSFKFRLLSPTGTVTQPWHHLYVAYTQTSLWGPAVIVEALL